MLATGLWFSVGGTIAQVTGFFYLDCLWLYLRISTFYFMVFDRSLRSHRLCSFVLHSFWFYSSDWIISIDLPSNALFSLLFAHICCWVLLVNVFIFVIALINTRISICFLKKLFYVFTDILYLVRHSLSFISVDMVYLSSLNIFYQFWCGNLHSYIQ